METEAPGQNVYKKFHLLPKTPQQLTFNKGKVLMSVHVVRAKKPLLSVQTQRSIEHARSSFAADNSAVKRLQRVASENTGVNEDSRFEALEPMNLQAVYQRRRKDPATHWKGAAPSKSKKDLWPASNEFILKRQRRADIEVRIERKGPRPDKPIV